MKVVGIITEYNPFHHGHHFQLQRVREITKADVIIVLMSGNVVQRGEFAIIDKWHRSEIALKLGADLVIELPLLASLQSADYFARVGVEMLVKLGCDTIAFGTEGAEAEALIQHVDWAELHDESLQSFIRYYLKQGFSYAAAYQSAIDQIADTMDFKPFSATQPNHLLAIQYVRANKQLGMPLEIIAVPRLTTLKDSAVHTISWNAPKDDSVQLASGSQIRAAWWNHQFHQALVPQLTADKLGSALTVHWPDYWQLLRYQIMSHSPDTLRQVFGVKEGIEHRMLDVLDVEMTFSEYCQQLISKRWTQASIQRILLAVLLNIHEQEWKKYRKTFEKSPLLRILGYNSAGRSFLKLSKPQREVELFSNLGKQHHDRYALTVRSDKIMGLNSSVQFKEQNYNRYPIQV